MLKSSCIKSTEDSYKGYFGFEIHHREKMRLGVLAFLLFAGVVNGHEHEHGSATQILLSVQPTTEAQLSALKDVEKSNEFAEFLDKPTELKIINILVTPESKDQLVNDLQNAGLTVTDNTPQLLKHIRKERSVLSGKVWAKRGACRKYQAFPTHEKYYSLSEINAFMATFAKCYPRFARMKKMEHKTYENRDVFYMEIGPRSIYGDNHPWGKKVIMIEALAHPREWITTAAALYAIQSLVQVYALKIVSNTTKLLNHFNFVIIPVVNPDGYEYTWNTDRLWRKNRRVINSTCTGVNLNRNYDVEFRTTGISKACGSPNYPGETAFSEAETQNVKKLFDSMYARIHTFLSVHSSSQVLLYPWSYIDSNCTHEVPSNVEDLITVGEAMMTKLKDYKFGTAFNLLHHGASGAAEDWALQAKPGIYAYRYGLSHQPRTTYGFDLPESQISNIGLYFTRSVWTLVEKSVELYREKEGQPVGL